MSNNRLTVTKILNKLYIDLHLQQIGREGYICCPYQNFKRFMMLDETMEPVITYERTIKEKFKLMQDFGFISRTNVVNIPAIMDHLGIEA